jgi:hypothetical protein
MKTKWSKSDMLPENIKDTIDKAVAVALEQMDIDAMIREIFNELDIASIIRKTLTELQAG